VIVLALAAVLVWQDPAGDSLFSHNEHARLFTSCTTCHSGIATGREADVMPNPQQCATCHDGRTEQRVTWRPRRLEPSNLRFRHAVHERELRRSGDSALACVACHAQQNAATFMAAGRAEPERCIGCHAHRAPLHLAAAAQCNSCHLPLREARALSVSRIARFPTPPSHDADFAADHGTAARASGASCQFCHTRESCARCHANAARLPEITALGSDARVAAMVALLDTRYPVPASHRSLRFTEEHGPAARAANAGCANCHTSQSCLTCHGSDARPAAVAQLPAHGAQGAPGVDPRTAARQITGRASAPGIAPPPPAGPFSARHATRSATALPATRSRRDRPSTPATSFSVTRRRRTAATSSAPLVTR
jgi:hypothetical protein